MLFHVQLFRKKMIHRILITSSDASIILYILKKVIFSDHFFVLFIRSDNSFRSFKELNKFFWSRNSENVFFWKRCHHFEPCCHSFKWRNTTSHKYCIFTFTFHENLVKLCYFTINTLNKTYFWFVLLYFICPNFPF